MSYYLTLLPLIVAISLVYSTSRHESWAMIGKGSLRLGAAIVGILLVTSLLLLLINTQV